ncbi:MAG: hypothetical protein JNL10_19835 [Verrucomicrobiales bacterium]|nr:hypothetical protein [Verrucomicrobiales bacterium]
MTNLPTYITSSEEILWGIALVAVTLLIHGFGMILTLRTSASLKARFGHSTRFVAGMGILILTSWIITLVHILEVMIWAAFFQWKHCFPNYSTAGYFAFLEYTTVGSSLNLPQNWRLLEGMIATAGLLGFAWSTGVLMTLAQEFQDQQMQRLQRVKVHHHESPSDPTLPASGNVPARREP